MNISSYTGRRYDFRNYNCWHHVRAVRADAGIKTPAFDVLTPVQINRAFDDGHSDSKGLVRVDSPENYDAVLMGVPHGSRVVWHAGVYFEGNVSHCDRHAKQVKLESLTDIKSKFSEIEFWR